MTEDAPTQQEDGESTVQPGSLADNVSMIRPDYALEEFQGLANETGAGFGVTLTVNGAVISGNIISGQRFFEQTAEIMRGAEVVRDHASDDVELGGVPESLARMFDGFKRFYPVRQDLPEGEAEPFVPPIYVHLENAKAIQPGGGRTALGFWRGRLSHVSGWSLGCID